MSRRRRPTAFTAPFLASHGDAEAAAALRRAGEVLAAGREQELPGEAAPTATSARLRVQALADELDHLATWARGASQLVSDCLEGGKTEAAYLCSVLGNAGLRLGPLVRDLDEALRDSEAKAAAWEAGRGDPFEAAKSWLLRMASVMRSWAPEVLRRWEAMLPLLPDEQTRTLMSEADRETEEVAFYHLRDSVLGDVLSEGISNLETWGGREISASTVHRQLSPSFDAFMREER